MKRIAFSLIFAAAVFLGTTDAHAQLQGLKDVVSGIASAVNQAQDGTIGSTSVRIPADALYVCRETGSNRNDGSRNAPFKNLQKAIDAASDGQTIIVSEGVYMGNLDCGTIEIKDKAVKIYGGFSKDFSRRDITGTPTLIQPDEACKGKRNATNYTFGLIANKPVGEIVLDGLVFNHGNQATYLTDAMQEKKGPRPAGIESNNLCPIPGSGGVGGPNLDIPTKASTTYQLRMSSNSNGVYERIVINNCVFVNADNFAIEGSVKADVVITNNVFCNVTYAACQIAGAYPSTQYGQQATGPRTTVEFAYNTVLFVWMRDITPDSDMGWAYRYMNGTDSNVHHNIFGCSAKAALDRGFKEHNSADAARQIATCDDNIFFCNKQADLMLPGSGKMLPVRVENLEDVEQLTGSVRGNKSVEDATVFNGRIDDAYLKAFINAQYSESTSYDSSSAVNQFRSAFGMNQTGSISIKVNFYANRYPWKRSFDLFGAVPGYGAQQLR